ncbi:MAG: EexN family lipoprotein [Rhodopila sp.]|jgi:hypothetical protein
MNVRNYAGTAALMALSAGLGAGGAVYMRPLQPPQPSVAIAPSMPTAHPIRTVTWFKEHEPEMAEKQAACDDNPGGTAGDPECTNAEAASEQISMQRAIDDGNRQLRAAGVLK